MRDSARCGQSLLALAIVTVTFLAYFPVLSAGFIWDDDKFLTDNQLIHSSDGLRRFWLTTEPPDYFPLTSSMLWVEWRLWGMNPLGYHAVNVLLHALSAVLLWQLLKQLKIPGAWLAGLLFAVHPVTVESVAWITERKNVLPMVFYLASILAWLRFDECGVRNAECGTNAGAARSGFPSSLVIRHSAFCDPYYLLSLFLFLLALLAKTSVVMLPVALLLIAWWKRGKIAWNDLRRSIPFFALSAALSLVTIWYQYHRAIRVEVIRTDGLLERTAGAGWAVWFYLYKALLPTGLCFVYPRWETSASLLAFVPALLIAALLLLFWRYRRGWGKPFFFAGGYFVASLLPVLGFLNIYFMRYSLVADHWEYTALIGIVAAAAAGLALLMAAGGIRRAAAIAAAAGILGCCGALTWSQTLIYQDVELLWRDTLRLNPNSWLAHNNLGVALLRKKAAPRGTPAPTPQAVREALQEFDLALRLRPDVAESHYGRGLAYDTIGRSDLALGEYSKAIELKQDYAGAYSNRGTLLARAGRYAEALRDYDRAIALVPSDGRDYNNRGNVYASLDRPDLALRDFDQAIELEPDLAMAYSNRANVYVADGRLADALRDYSAAIRLQPGLASAYYGRAKVFYRTKEYAKALADVRAYQELGGRADPEFLHRLAAANDFPAGPERR